ncbi:MAG: thaumatin family protein, partial [Pseudomonadota bacterium]
MSDGDCDGGSCNSAGYCVPPLVSCASTTCAGAGETCHDSATLGEVCVPRSSCCGPYDSDWITAATVAGGGASPFTAFFKQACPNAYSYQFDDPSSDFTCANPDMGKNAYQVTFCPVPEPSGWLLTASALLVLDR